MTTTITREPYREAAIRNHLISNNGAFMLQSKQGYMLDVFPTDIVEPIRQMVTQCVYRDGFPKIVSVVSAMQEEGVTYISRALATALAHDNGRSVCLLDLNWCSPNKASSEMLEVYPGITDILYNGIAVDEALIPTTNPFLSLLLAGGVDPRQRPILSRSKELKALIGVLSKRFDHLFLDIPAIKTSSDAVALASLGNSCCVVVRHGATSTTIVGQTLSEIQHMPIMGILLNRVSNKTPTWIQKLVPQD